MIANGTSSGVHLNFNSLGVINGIIDEYTQAPYYPEFAVNNTYGIKLYNDTIYQYAKIALNMPNGCLNLVEYCRAADRDTQAGQSLCSEAASMCRDNVEGVYYNFGGKTHREFR